MPLDNTINRQRLLDRFLRYVKLDTAADPTSSDYPSSQGQLELGQILAEELLEMGAAEAHQDEHGLVWATIAAVGSPPADASGPVVLLNAHLDTSPEAPSVGVAPQVISSYQGGDIPLKKGGQIIDVATCSELRGMHGHTLVTTDGSTLLGGDDKAGVAAIMEVAQYLLENPELPHAELRVLFTCDEEIGCGAKHVDLEKAAATAGYTLDGGGRAVVENETFSADQLNLRVLGNNIHPSIGKGRLVNALRVASRIIAELPTDKLSPESTEGRDGFLHPYDFSGSVAESTIKILLRDFDTAKLDDYEQIVREIAKRVEAETPGASVDIQRLRQYRNMADALRAKPEVVDLALKAYEAIGLTAELGAIRGGTDGAVLTEMGLPTPNLAVGQHNIHSVREFVSLDEMETAVRHAVQLLQLWGS